MICYFDFPVASWYINKLRAYTKGEELEVLSTEDILPSEAQGTGFMLLA